MLALLELQRCWNFLWWSQIALKIGFVIGLLVIPVTSHGALEARSFSVIHVLGRMNWESPTAVRFKDQSSLIQIHIFFFFSSAHLGSKRHRVPVGNRFGIFWTALVPWADSPTVFDSEGTQQSDR